MDRTIFDIAFQKPDEHELEFEAFTIRSFFARPSLPAHTGSPERLHFYLMLFFTEGHGSHIIDFRHYAYKPGTLLFIAPNQVHQFQPNASADGYMFLFTEHFLYRHAQERDVLLDFWLFDYSIHRPVLDVQGEAYNELSSIADLLVKHYRHPNDFAKEELLRSLLKVLVLQTERFKKEQTALPQPIRSYTDFQAFQRLIEQHYVQHWKVKDYAAALGRSTKTLTALTRRTTGRSPKHVIDARLLLEIKRLLAHTSLSVKTIAYELGFDEPTNLVKFFRRFESCTPQQFRRSTQ